VHFGSFLILFDSTLDIILQAYKYFVLRMAYLVVPTFVNLQYYLSHILATQIFYFTWGK
jgi:hypothetical protein